MNQESPKKLTQGTQKWAEILATFFYVGKIPKAPGTFGTIAAIPLALALNYAGVFVYMGLTLVLIVLAILSAEIYERILGGHDHKSIVVDEVVGFLVTMTWMPMTWQAYLAGFLLFRLLDISKPFPIGYLDKKIPGGFGVVVDDLVAGILANIILQMLYTQTHLLGARVMLS